MHIDSHHMSKYDAFTTMLINPSKGAQVKHGSFDSLSPKGNVKSLKIYIKYINEFRILISWICLGCSPKH